MQRPQLLVSTGRGNSRPRFRRLALGLLLALIPSLAAANDNYSMTVSNVTSSGATLTVKFWDNNPPNQTWYWRGYTTSNNSAVTSCVEVASGTGAVTLTGLDPATGYRYHAHYDIDACWVVPGDNGLMAKATFTTSAAVPDAPGKPGTTAGILSVALSWSAGDNNGSAVTGWKYAQSAGGASFGSWTSISGAGASTTSHTVTGLDSSVSYKFKVRAVNGVGDGDESPESDAVTPLAQTAPLAPGKPSATRGNRSVALSWSAGGDGGSAITSWKYAQSAGGGGFGSWTSIPNSGASTTSYTVTGLTNGTSYKFKVRAVNANGDGEASPASDAATPATRPPAPGQPTGTTGDKSVALTWSSNGDGGSAITSWKYSQSTSGASFGSWTSIPNSGASTTSYTVTGLTDGTSYRFKVRAVNDLGDGAESPASASVLAASAPGKPGTPSVTVGLGSLSVSWSAPTDNGTSITGYDIEHRSWSGSAWGNWTGRKRLGASATSTVVDGLTNGTRYQVRVRAVNQHRDGPWSDPREGKPIGAPGTMAAPTVATGSTPGTLNVSWTAPSDGGSPITSYQILRQDCSACGRSVSEAPGSATSKTLTGLKKGKEYWVSVRATNAEGYTGGDSPRTTAWTSGNPDDNDDGSGGDPGGDGNPGGGSPGGGSPGGGSPDGDDEGDDDSDDGDDGDDGGDDGGGNGNTGQVPTPRWIGDMAVESVGRQTMYLFWRGEWAERSRGMLMVEARSREHGWRDVMAAPAPQGLVRIGEMKGDSAFTFRLRETRADGTVVHSGMISGTTGMNGGPCRSTADDGDGALERFLCLRDGRFEVRVHWASPDGSGKYGSGIAVPVAISDESGLFWFFDSNNVELVVKVLDGRALNGSHWVFYGALSDVEYWVTVRDVVAEVKRTWYNPPKEMCGRGDVNAFKEPESDPAAAGSPAVDLAGDAVVRAFEGVDLLAPGDSLLAPTVAGQAASGGQPEFGTFDLVSLEAAPLPEGAEQASTGGSCVPGAARLCLLDGRFAVEVAFVDPNAADAETQAGRVLPSLTTRQTGFFWFFDHQNIELAVKALDGRALNGRFWLLYGGLSDVEYTLTVTDTVTGLAQPYRNEAGNLCGGIDTNAF